MHGGVFQIKVPVHYAWWSLQMKDPYTIHGGVFQIKVPVHNAWWSLSN